MIVRPNAGTFLVPAVYKVRSSGMGCKNLWIFCQGTSNYLDLLRVEYIKREIRCQIFINILQKRKIFPVVYCKRLKGWNGIREISGKWLNIAVQLYFFRCLRARLLHPIPSSDNQSQTKKLLQLQILKRRLQGYIVKCITWASFKSWKPQKACASEYQNWRWTRVTNRAV
jgi:hypothetical protein